MFQPSRAPNRKGGKRDWGRGETASSGRVRVSFRRYKSGQVRRVCLNRLQPIPPTHDGHCSLIGEVCIRSFIRNNSSANTNP
nr:MAG TPA: hypothetical protein [Microviridae sp.]